MAFDLVAYKKYTRNGTSLLPKHVLPPTNVLRFKSES